MNLIANVTDIRALATVATVPEPASLGLLGIAIAALLVGYLIAVAGVRRKERKNCK